MRKGIKNILKILNAADDVDVNEGRIAYFRYREMCVSIQQLFPEYTLEQVVAVLAATSPNNDYVGNLRTTVTILDAHRHGRTYCNASSYGACRRRAFSYLDGVSFLGTVKGEKIRAFYHNILNPIDPFNVTIDGHAVNIWRGMREPLKGLKAFKYKQVAEDYRAVARSVGLLPSQLQAITWFAWKRINKIFYNPPQLHLFEDRSGNFWRTLIHLEEIYKYEQREVKINQPSAPEIDARQLSFTELQ